jgi:hypothetical protein
LIALAKDRYLTRAVPSIGGSLGSFNQPLSRFSFLYEKEKEMK